MEPAGSIGATMTQMVCVSCGREFRVRPQSPKQTFCSDPECQRERRRRWSRDKLESDQDYRANQLAAQQAWHARNPDYWQIYRGRRRMGEPPVPSRPAPATSDASICGGGCRANRYWMDISTAGLDGSRHTWRVEFKLRCRPSCNDGRVQTDDSWPLPPPPPNVRSTASKSK
jgi:hypothetical protein